MKALPTIYSIKGPWKGQLAIVPRPRGGDRLEDELRGWEEGGLDVIVSLLPATEAGELGLAEEATLTKAHGLQFFHFPIPDFSVPPACGRAVPDTSEQREWVRNFARYLPTATIQR